MSITAIKALNQAISASNEYRANQNQLNQAMSNFNADLLLQQSSATYIAQRARTLWREICDQRRKSFDEPIDWMNGIGLVRYDPLTNRVQGTLLSADTASLIVYANVLFSFQLLHREDNWMTIHNIQSHIAKVTSHTTE